MQARRLGPQAPHHCRHARADVGLMVHSADIQDRDGAPDLLKSIKNRWPCLLHVFADGGYAANSSKSGCRKSGNGHSKSSNVPTRPRVCKSCRPLVVERPSPGWVDAADWPRTSKNASLPAEAWNHHRSHPPCSPDALQDMDIVETFSSPTVRNEHATLLEADRKRVE